MTTYISILTKSDEGKQDFIDALVAEDFSNFSSFSTLSSPEYENDRGVYVAMGGDLLPILVHNPDKGQMVIGIYKKRNFDMHTGRYEDGQSNLDVATPEMMGKYGAKVVEPKKHLDVEMAFDCLGQNIDLNKYSK